MNDENEVKKSPLCQAVTVGGKTVQVDIIEDGEGGWLLEVIDEHNNTTGWEDAFDTEKSALSEALDTIEQEGIGALIGMPKNKVH